MYDFIRKTDLWRFWDANLHKEFDQTKLFHLKTIQDLAVFEHLKAASGLRIAEIGGGESRLLATLQRNNTCFNVEKFEGQDGGPGKEVKVRGVENVKVFLGENSPLLPTNSFDIVFSVSVIEHVPTGQLDAFFEDGLRILKPGGLWLHAIDIYLEDSPQHFIKDRFERYRDWVRDPRIDPVGNILDGEPAFSPDIATNPDNVMYEWGKVAPKLIALRQQAQSASLLLAGRKRA